MPVFPSGFCPVHVPDMTLQLSSTFFAGRDSVSSPCTFASRPSSYHESLSHWSVSRRFLRLLLTQQVTANCQLLQFLAKSWILHLERLASFLSLSWSERAACLLVWEILCFHSVFWVCLVQCFVLMSEACGPCGSS